ncbi:MAG: heme-binding protein [Xanthomonadales bacterium]|jgi:effector-binding domain-containing protein|nr:heme-binding protein [Xanthomonadales bacterium]
MKAMKTPALMILAPLLMLAPPLQAVEEAEYRVVRQDGDIEIREYAAFIVAEVVVDEEFEDAGNRAFRALFKYIDGNNRDQREIAMTAPVSQQKTSTKIAMTAPVSQQQTATGWAVSFMMPASFTMNTLPRPLDPAVSLREVPAHRAASLRYSGTWSEKRYREHLERLGRWLDENGLKPAGQPVWARYNAPFTPWFMRRNEILVRLGGES